MLLNYTQIWLAAVTFSFIFLFLSQIKLDTSF